METTVNQGFHQLLLLNFTTCPIYHVFRHNPYKCTSTRNTTKFRSKWKSLKKTGKLIIQLDEMWSFVGSKDNKEWIWLAIDANTREIVGVHVGDRSHQSAKGLWRSLPLVYRQCAVGYTDFWEAYEQVLPSKRHRAVGKGTGKTNYIERFNNTLRQRVGRLVRKTLSFSKKLSNHIGAIWYFVHHYNASLQS